jgi:hypothetical protein
MAITQNTYTGNGSTVLFSFTFPYLRTTDIKVSLDGSVTTAYTLANATTIQFNTAPANGVAIRIYRETDDTDLDAEFFPGSAIRSQDLNDNFDKILYIAQETKAITVQAATGDLPDGSITTNLIAAGAVTDSKLSFTPLKSTDLGVSVQSYDADTVKTDVLPTFTVATRSTERTITAGAFDLATGNLWTCGAITVPNPTNAVAGQTGAIRITAGPVVWSSNFKFPGGTAPTIATFPAVIPYYVQDSSTILMGYVSEGIA